MDERPTDEEMNAMIADLVEAGLFAVGHDAAGRETWTLTTMGAQVGRQLAKSDEAGQDALMAALLGPDAHS